MASYARMASQQCQHGSFASMATMIDIIDFSHTSSNFISMVVTRASSKFSKNHTFLMCRMQKWMKIFCSSLDIRDNLKVAFFGKILSNMS
jgi:hypothetical protein